MPRKSPGRFWVLSAAFVMLAAQLAAARTRTPGETGTDAARRDAMVQRVLSFSVCGHSFWGGDCRRSHAFLYAGDSWLARGDRSYDAVLRGGKLYLLEVARRQYNAARDEYRAARLLSPTTYSWRTSPRPDPIPDGYRSDWHTMDKNAGPRIVHEKPFWGKFDQVPVE